MYQREHQHYLRQVESEQFCRCLSNKAMAELLYLPVSTYKNLIYGRTSSIELSLIMRMYELNGKMMYDMVGARPPKELLISQLYKELGKEQQRLVDDFIFMLLKTKKE